VVEPRGYLPCQVGYRIPVTGQVALDAVGDLVNERIACSRGCRDESLFMIFHGSSRDGVAAAKRLLHLG
jgi:hypothetical protein